MSESNAHVLDSRLYTDPAVFESERRGLFMSTWQFAGHVSQIPNPGDYFAFEIAGERLFCLRDRRGEIRVFYNVCQHRAHGLVEGAGNAKLIVCPYHAWTYELSGELRSGPNIDAAPDIDRRKICLTGVQVENFHGFLFVNLDPNAKPMDDWFPDVRAELLDFVPHIERLKPIVWKEAHEKCNWKVSVENYSECYHCALNHPSFTAGVIRPDTYNIAPQGYCLRHTTKCQNLDKMDYHIDVDSNANAGEYSTWYLWPTFSFQVYPGNILNTYHWRPTAHDEVVVSRGWYSIDGAPSPEIAKMAQRDRETTVEEDVSLVESVQRGLASRGYKPSPLVIDPNGGVMSEHSVKTLRGWVRDAIEKDKGLKE